MTNSYTPTYWVDNSTPAISATNLRKLEKGVANAHGIVDTAIESTGKVDRVIVNDGAGHYLQVPSLTTSERDALAATNGMIIYNSTVKCFQARRDGAWVDLHAGTIREDLNLGGSKIISLGAPTNDADAATKQYVDMRPAATTVAANAYLVGSSWYRTNPAKPAWRVTVDENTDLCRFQRAPSGSGVIEWTDVCQIGPAGLRPRICVASSNIRYESLASVGARMQSTGLSQTLKTYRIPAGAPYYLAGHYQMSVRVTAKASQSTPYTDDTQILRYVVVVDGVEKWSATITNNGTMDISADVSVNPYSSVEIVVQGYSIPLYCYADAAVSDFRIGATDVFADGTGW